jgi:hypothetical protein
MVMLALITQLIKREPLQQMVKDVGPERNAFLKHNSDEKVRKIVRVIQLQNSCLATSWMRWLLTTHAGVVCMQKWQVDKRATAEQRDTAVRLAATVALEWAAQQASGANASINATAGYTLRVQAAPEAKLPGDQLASPADTSEIPN